MLQFKAIKTYETQLRPYSRDMRYAFATGRLTVLGDRLLGGEKLHAVLSRPDPDQAITELLDEAGYPTAPTPDERIRLGLIESSALLKEVTQSDALAKGLLLEEDIHNLKLFLKYLRSSVSKLEDMQKAGEAGAQAADGSAGAPADGQVPEAISDLLFAEAYVAPARLWQGLNDLSAAQNAMSGPVAELLKLAADEVRSWSGDYRVAAIDFRLDRKRFERLDKIADEAEDTAVKTYLKAYREFTADLGNLQMCLRMLRLGISADTAADLIVSGGRVPAERVREAYHGGFEALLSAFEHSSVAEMLPVAREFVRTGDPFALSKAYSEALLSFAMLGHEAGFGPAQVGGYWLAKRAEAQNLRILLALTERAAVTSEPEAYLRGSYRGGRA